MPNTQEDSLFESGMRVRRQVLGNTYVDGAMASQDPITQEFQQFMVPYCWGEIWTDDTLPLATRSLLVIAMTAALGRLGELKIHTTGALRNGVSPQELLAAIKQISVYSGVPAGVSALKIVREAMAEFDSSAD